MPDSLLELKRRLSEVRDLEMVYNLLEWDQETQMPPGGAGARAEQLGTLKRLEHERLTSDEIGALLEQARAEVKDLPYDSDDASLVRVVSREYHRKRRVPSELVGEIARVTGAAYTTWARARAESNFRAFAPELKRIFELKRQWAECFEPEASLYDPLLDEYEPGMKTAQVREVFARLKAELVPLVRAISAKGEVVDASFLTREYDEQKQWDFGVEVLRRYGFDLQRGRQDRSLHPFTIHFSSGDVRITTRFERNHPTSALFSTMHEAGHGMYEQGVSPALDRSMLGNGASLGLHESQSRLWENLIGRSRGFWKFFFPQLKDCFPDPLADVGLEQFYRAINRVEPSLVRVEADEVTYNLHIMLRFELEQDLLEGRVGVDDLPEVWNARMLDYLGVTPPNDALGVLQDIHWSSGLVGYFPTYSLGNLLSVQLYEAALKDHPDIPAHIERGEFDTLREWMRARVYVHGKKLTPPEIVQQTTGGPLSAEPYLRYLKAKYSKIYGL